MTSLSRISLESVTTLLRMMNLALEDYKKMYLMGHSGITDAMRRCFDKATVKTANFDAFIASLKPGGVSTGQRQLTKAPAFVARDLHGKVVRLEDFKGKIVVLNIWGIGCGPCIAEMPELNALVAQNAANKDVVFLGLSADETSKLKSFVRQRPFAYRILNQAGSIPDQFHPNTLPVHIIIGKNGEILSRFIGATPDIRSALQQIIDQHL